MPALFRRALKDFELSGRLIPKVKPLSALSMGLTVPKTSLGAAVPAYGACRM